MKTSKMPKIPKHLSQTEKKLAEMFMERVPNGIIDSGRVYGYNYERSRENAEWEKPDYHYYAEIYRENQLDLERAINTYWLLTQQLNYNEDWDKQFQTWRKQFEGDDWEEHLEEFPHPETGELCNNYERDWYGKGWNCCYTYNEDTILDRDIAFNKYDNFVIIRIHNGCDARWGFSEPVLFEIPYWAEFFPYADMSMECPECGTYWDYNHYSLNVASNDAKDLHDYPCEKGDKGKVGVVVVREDHQVFCPVCGKGVLR